MRTAIDTNIISALWSSEPTASAVSHALNNARLEGGLTVCGAVYAELLAHPKSKPCFVDEFLASGRILIDAAFEVSVWQAAGVAFASYSARRRIAKAGEPKRLLVDFIVGSHALLKADRLLTFDKSRYSSAFPRLKIVTP
jgi:predicted nucleic acid-binding protein